MDRLTRVRIVLVTAALALAVGLTSSYLSLRKTTASLSEQLVAFGTSERSPGAARDVAREPDLQNASLMAARALLAEELDRRWIQELEPGARPGALEQGEAKLELALDLALEVVREQPGSWQGLMIVGGARYLLASRRKAPGRWSDRGSWESPLLTAIARAPAQPEPRRVLAAAYLSEWSIASEPERREAMVVLEGAFRDLNTLEQLLPAWLGRATSLEQALSVISPDPRAWRQLDHYYRQRGDWQRLATVLERLEGSLPAYFDARIERAHVMVAGGRHDSARHLLLTTIDELPLRREYAGFLGAAIEALPPGPISERRMSVLREWLGWTADRCIVADCPFSRAVVERVTALAPSDRPGARAIDALLRGDLVSGVAVEERFLDPEDGEWLTYLLLKARLLADRGQADAALRLLEASPVPSERTALFAKLSREIAGGDSGSTAETADSGWFGRKRTYRREIASPKPLEPVVVRFQSVAEEGTLLEFRLNHGLAEFRAIESGSVLRLDLAPSNDFVVLELVRAAGGAYRPAGAI